MRVPQQMRREPPPDARVDRQLAQLRAGCGGRPAAPSLGPVDHAEQWAGRQRHAMRQPGRELLVGHWYTIPTDRLARADRDPQHLTTSQELAGNHHRQSSAMRMPGGPRWDPAR